jgi:hypothetical protein
VNGKKVELAVKKILAGQQVSRFLTFFLLSMLTVRCSLADPHWFPDTDPDPAFFVNADPDPGF